jgi:hypothetical protein
MTKTDNTQANLALLEHKHKFSRSTDKVTFSDDYNYAQKGGFDQISHVPSINLFDL